MIGPNTGKEKILKKTWNGNCKAKISLSLDIYTNYWAKETRYKKLLNSVIDTAFTWS